MIDLRSDTVTQPGEIMRRLMGEAQVGDDVYGEDPTVNRLQEKAAAMLGKEAALFVASGTQSNLLALISHCQRGEEYIVGQMAHTYRFEAGGAAVLGSIQAQPLDFEADGSLDLDRVAAAIKPDDPHFAQARLLCLENTHFGKVLPLDYQARASAFCKERGLALHLDGARIFNASVASGVAVEQISRHYDSVSVCLSKGLGAPVGSVLCGSAALIKHALRWRKMLGGGMRQAGILAAAALYALQHQVARLAEDHTMAARLGEALAGIEGFEVVGVATNMTFITHDQDRDLLRSYLAEHQILISNTWPVRLVTHLDVSPEDIEQVINRFASFRKTR